MSLRAKSLGTLKPRARKYILPSRSIYLPTPLKFETNLKILWIFSVLLQIVLLLYEKSINIVRSHQNTLNLSKIGHNPGTRRPEIGENGPKISKKWAKSTKKWAKNTKNCQN